MYPTVSPPFVESNRRWSGFPARLRPEHMLLVLVDTEQSSYWRGGGSGAVVAAVHDLLGKSCHDSRAHFQVVDGN